MAASPEPLMMTVEQYRQLPDCPGYLQELHWDPKKKTVTVLRRGTRPNLYTTADRIPLNPFGGFLHVSEIFGAN